MIRQTTILLLLIASTSCVSRSHGTYVSSPPTPTTRSADQALPILYHRTGGIAGTNDRVVIWPDGVIQVNGKVLPSTTARVNLDRLERLRRMFKGWDQLKEDYPTAAADAYTITISYGSQSVTAMDLAPDLPEQFRKIYTEIEAIAAAAENTDAKPADSAPESPTP